MTDHEALADTEARHAHRDLLAEKDAEIERLTALLDEARSHINSVCGAALELGNKEDLLCCSGFECGCMGATNHQLAEHVISEAREFIKETRNDHA